MTQQPYYPPQQPQQGYPAQPQQPAYQQPVAPPQQFAPQFPQAPGYPAPQVQQPYAQPQSPAAPLADGSLDAFYNQPNTGGGPGVSWKGKPDGFTIQGTVPRDVTNADVTQEVGAPNTQQAGQPQYYRDGRPKFVMAVPLQMAPSQEYPEGEARLFIRGQLKDELSRAMAEAGVEGAPQAGAVLTVTLVQRKQGRGTIPQNIFAVRYTPPGNQAPQVHQPQQPQQQAQPVQPQVQPQPVQQQYAPQPAQQPVQQVATGAPSPAPVAQAPAQPQQQSGPVPPAGLSPEQQAMLASMTGQAPAQQAG